MDLLNSNPNKTQSTSELILLIQVLERINTNIDTLRLEMKEWQRDTLETRALRSNMEIESLEAKDREYAIEMEKIKKAQDDVRDSLDKMKNGRGQTQEKMEAIATKVTTAVLSADKIDIRGIKLSSKQFTYVLIGVIILLAMTIIFLPDAVAQILMRMAGAISSTPTP